MRATDLENYILCFPKKPIEIWNSIAIMAD
jgi:hypothetical protein